MIMIFNATRPAPHFRPAVDPDDLTTWILLENGTIVGRGLTQAHAEFFAQAGNEKHARAVNAKRPIVLGEHNPKLN